ncbi:MAG TPA: exopolysaccharide biosynthesis protein [Arenibaculum sp.]|nr:exopolysaccharide biosynthesis protein [Arenibaculum sp.]
MNIEAGACDRRAGKRVTDILERFRAELPDRELPDRRITLADCVDVLGDRAFGGFVLLLSLPNILPLPWGMASVLCIPILLISAQMILGRRTLWLPAAVLRRGFDRAVVARMLDRAIPRLRWTERWLKPRLLFLTSPVAERAVGALFVFLCFVLVVPVPFLGWFPAFALVAVSLGLVERDGVVLAVGLLLSALTFLAAMLVFGGLAESGSAIIPGISFDPGDFGLGGVLEG